MESSSLSLLFPWFPSLQSEYLTVQHEPWLEGQLQQNYNWRLQKTIRKTTPFAPLISCLCNFDIEMHSGSTEIRLLSSLNSDFSGNTNITWGSLMLICYCYYQHRDGEKNIGMCQ